MSDANKHTRRAEEKEKLLRKIGVENRAQFISYLFEKTAAAYLNMAKRSPWHPKQKPRAVSIIWIYCNHPKEVDATALHALVDFAALLTKEENNILSLAPNQFMLLLLYYLQSQTKESLDHLKLILKVAGRTKIEEALQYYLILAGRHLRLDKFESLLCFLKENKSPFAPYLAMILALSQSATSDKDQFLSFSAVQDTGHSNNLKSHLAPAYHVLKEYLTQLFYALRGHEIMNHADPFALFNIDEEISSSYRNLLKYAPLRF